MPGYTATEEWQLNTARLGRRVLVYDEVDSTSDRAAALAQDLANDGVAVLADAQTAGRGQHGRSWTCVPGTGVLLSVLLFPPAPLRRPALLTAWAAVSVCETIRHLAALQPTIKWPNDVLIDGRKVCGILIEQARGTVVGIGLNLNQTAADFTRAALPEAGSLALFTDRAFASRDAARELITRLDAEYDRLCRGDLAGLETRWAERLGLLNREVDAECTSGTRQGVVRDIALDGVVLQARRGQLLRLQPETIRHLHVVPDQGKEKGG